mgnify:CR=1 FL=1
MRSAIPNRHATAEATEFPPRENVSDTEAVAWADYVGGSALIKRTIAGEAPRAIVTTGCDDPAKLLAQFAITVSANDGKVVVVVPDRAAIDRIVAALHEHGCPKSAVAILAADTDFHENLPRVLPQNPSAKDRFADDAIRIAAALANAKTRLTKAGFGKIDYFDLRHSDSLEPAESQAPNCRIFAAIWLGKTRLIDNYAL